MSPLVRAAFPPDFSKSSFLSLIFSLSFRVCHHNSALHSPLISLSHLSYLFPSRCLLECSLQLHPALPLICARHLSYLLSTRCLLECVTTTPRCIHPDFSKSSFLSLIFSLPFRVCHYNSTLHSPWSVHVIFLISYLIAAFQSVSSKLRAALPPDFSKSSFLSLIFSLPFRVCHYNSTLHSLPLICARHLSYLLSYRCLSECVTTTPPCTPADLCTSSFLSLILSLSFRVYHHNSALHSPLISPSHLSYLLSSPLKPPNTGSHTLIWTHENTTHTDRNG